MGALGEYFWLFDLLSHFRLQYIALLAGAGVILLMIGRWRHGGLSLLVAMALAMPILFKYYWQPSTIQAIPQTNSVSLLSFNVLTSNSNKQAVVDYISEGDPDFAFAMETDFQWVAALKTLEEQYPYSVYQPESNNFGLSFLSKHKIVDYRIERLEAGVATLVVHVEIQGTLLRIIGTHPVPPVAKLNSKQRDSQLSKVADLINEEPSIPTVLAGDLNTSIWSHAFKKLKARAKLSEPTHGFGIQTTWRSNSILFAIPIDHVLGNHLIRFLGKKVDASLGSDHNPLRVEFSVVPEYVTF
jgi:endonuclease/exonuclease/phosphatase (EEP) superfamily protein YafD